jgi:bla regulator protein blaR1
MSALIALVLKGSILMIAAAAAIALMYRASAATRHFVWTLSVVGLLLLPVFAASLPQLEIAVPIAPIEVRSHADEPNDLIAVPPARTTVTGPVATTPDDSALSASSVPWVLLPAAVYVFGLLALLGRLVMQHKTARRIARDATTVSDPEWTALLGECATRIGGARARRRPVALLRSRDQLMPMTMGTVAPVIVVPADADTWNEEQRRAVLLHELAHVARHDCLTQMLSAIASAVYWVHPGMWYVARRLRVEREVACDDRVLAAGADAPTYAGYLLELAYAWSGRRAPALVVGMAGSRKLEGRMRAVLDSTRNRTAPTRRAWLAGTALAAAVLLPLAAMSLTTASARESFEEEQAARPQTSDRTIAAPDATSGTWEVSPTRTPGRVSLRVRLGGSSFNGDVDVNEMERLTGQPLPHDGRIRFNVAREAGSFEIEGTVKAGAGSGTFRFVPSQSFIVGLTGRGFALPSAAELMVMATTTSGSLLSMSSRRKSTCSHSCPT